MNHFTIRCSWIAGFSF